VAINNPHYKRIICHLGGRHTGTSDILDLCLSSPREELGLNDNWLPGEATLAKHLEEARLGDVDHRHVALGSDLLLRILLADSAGHEGPQAIHIHSGAVVVVLHFVEMAHTDLTEVARVVFVHDDAVVVLATSVTATTRMLAVLPDTTVSVRHVATGLPCFLQTCRLGG